MKDKAGKDRPWLFRGIRGLEAFGLISLLFGLASSKWLVAVAGIATILGSYSIYRRWFPVVRPRDNPSIGPGDAGD